MWCADCQQDVPAVVRAANEPLVCPRCQAELAVMSATVPSDAGISLDSFDQTVDEVISAAEQELAPPRDWFAEEPTRQRMREIDRMLHSPYRQTPSAQPSINQPGGNQLSPALQQPWPNQAVPPATQYSATHPPAILPTAVPLKSVAQQAAAVPPGERTRKKSWLLSLLLIAGVATFSLGLGLLAWSSAFQLPQLWQQGMTLTIGAEGLLIISLAWMAVRLWKNGRQVNRQLHGVDRQLAEIEQLTGTLAGSQQSSSQHYYHHFSQVASPHLLVANLQGQVDQLAARMSG